MPGNQQPIFSRVGDIQGGVFANAAAADYTGQATNNYVVFVADNTNGGFVQRLRFKANGTNVATVARIYVNNGNGQYATICSTPGTPTVANSSGGSLPNATYFARVQAFDAVGAPTAWSSNSAGVAVAGGALTVGWTAVANAYAYRVLVGVTGAQEHATFTSTSNTVTVTSIDHLVNTSIIDYGAQQTIYNNYLIGECSLPATTTSTTSATAEIEYPLNIALPPGYRILVGLGAAVVGGWWITAIGGKY